MKVLTVLGTRPEIIRLSRVMARLDQHLDHVLVHTGQNADHTLNEALGLRRPDHDLGIDASSVGRAYGEVLIDIEPVLESERPDAVVILGDTNSSIAAVMARRMGIDAHGLHASPGEMIEGRTAHTTRADDDALGPLQRRFSSPAGRSTSRNTV